MSASAAHIVNFDYHQVAIIEIDGIHTDKKDADFIYLSASQRHSVFIEAQKAARKNYAFLSSMDLVKFGHVPKGLNPDVTGCLVHGDAKPLPTGPSILAKFKLVDDFQLVPYDRQRRLKDPNKTALLDAEFKKTPGGV